MIIAFAIAIRVLILYFLRSFLLALPEQYRKMQPNMVWLGLIPCFDMIWNFMMTANISQSYQAYYYERGRYEFKDCGATLGLWYSSCTLTTALLAWIPCVGICFAGTFGPASLILLILYFVKLSEMKNQLAMTAPGMPPKMV